MVKLHFVLIIHLICHPGAELKIRVDDELHLFEDGVEKVNSFAEDGSAHETVFTVSVSEDSCVMAARMYNKVRAIDSVT